MSLRFACATFAFLAWSGSGAHAAGYAAWPELPSRFASTGGGGVVIDGYHPVVTGDRCVTTFTALTPDGGRYHNYVEFDAVPAEGGILCANGRWRALEGGASGTTPLRVFIRDGVIRGSAD
jgi:hypothetical protein